MSGICGIYYKDCRPVPYEVLEAMMTTLLHRGPDGSGVWWEGPIGLGHQMLHTTPESLHEKLPFKDSFADFVITADARLDNRNELYEALNIPLYEQIEIPDSNLILKAYEKWGEECPTRLVGDFSFAIWDNREKKIFCARDHIGIKPFYYHNSSDLFVFSNEIKGILAVPEVPCRLNEIAVADFLVCNQSDLEITFYEEIRRLPPGCILALKVEDLRIVRYWEPELWNKLQLSSNLEYAEALRERMFEAVDCRMRSAFPIGVTLSGGLDSSSVACIAAHKLRERGKQLTAVSSVLPENHSGIESDEREYIEEVRIQAGNIDVEYVIAEDTTPFDNLSSLFHRVDQPIVDTFHYMNNALCAAAEKHNVRILLTGFGGDMGASFNGAGYTAQLARSCHWMKLTRLLKERALVEGSSQWDLWKREVFGFFARSFHLWFYSRVKRKPTIEDWVARTAIHPVLARKVSIDDRCRGFCHTLGNSVLPNAQLMMLKAVSANNLSSALECMAASQSVFGIEQCHPLLDRRIIEFCLSVPSEQFVSFGWSRNLIRQAMEKMLPPKVRFRIMKHPFTPDYHRRIQKATPQILQWLSESTAEESDELYVNKEKIRCQLKRVQPVKGWSEWEAETQLIVGFGTMVDGFQKWFNTHRIPQRVV